MEGTVLIIDDNKKDMLLIKFLFQDAKLDYKILWAANGEHGLEMARKERPEIIFLDGFMPGLNGFEVLEHLKMIPNAQMYIIMMTDSIETVHTLNLKGILADGHCVKQPEQILREMSKYHQQKIDKNNGG